MRSLFIINLIRNAFIEQQFDYSYSLSQKLLTSIDKTLEKQDATSNLNLLKANAIRFLCLSKEAKLQYNQKSPNFDSGKIMSDLTNLYEKIIEADQCFTKSLSWKGPSIHMAQGLCYFQHGMILEKMSQFYTLDSFTQEEIDHH